MTKLGDLIVEIDWLEDKIRDNHPIVQFDLKEKLIDAYVQKKRLTGERLNHKATSIYERTADMKLMLEEHDDSPRSPN